MQKFTHCSKDCYFYRRCYRSNCNIYFPVIAQDYETRRYSYGFVTAANTRYTFETFRQYSLLSFEMKIDKTVFFDTKTNWNVDEDKLQINVQTINDKEKIIFNDDEGNIFSKLLD